MPKLLASKAFKDKKFKEVKVGKHTIYEDQGQDANGPDLPSALKQMSLCLAEPKVFLIGSSKSLQAILTRNKDATLSDSMKAIMKRADMKKSVVVAVDVKAIRAQFPKEMEELKKKVKSGHKVDAAILTLTVKKDLAMDAVLICEDEAAAEDLRKTIEGLVTVAGMGLEAMGGPSEVKDALNAIVHCLKKRCPPSPCSTARTWQGSASRWKERDRGFRFPRAASEAPQVTVTPSRWGEGRRAFKLPWVGVSRRSYPAPSPGLSPAGRVNSVKSEGRRQPMEPGRWRGAAPRLRDVCPSESRAGLANFAGCALPYFQASGFCGDSHRRACASLRPVPGVARARRERPR